MNLISASRKGKRFPAEILTNAEVARLFAATTGGRLGKRNRWALAMACYVGLRAGEICRLRACDIDVAGRMVRVLVSKGGKSRSVGLPEAAIPYVVEWVAVRQGPIAGPLWVDLRGRGLDRESLRAVVKRLARKAGIAKRTTPHTGRHFFAASASRAGVPIIVISSALGHTALSSTAVYLAGLADHFALNEIQNLRF